MGGGEVAGFFFTLSNQSRSSVPAHFGYIFGPPAGHPPFIDTHANSGTLPRSHYTFKPRNNINSFQKKTFTKSLGAMAPPLATPLHSQLFGVHFHASFAGGQMYYERVNKMYL